MAESFLAELSAQTVEAERELADAEAAGDDGRRERALGRLADLAEIAGRNGIPLPRQPEEQLNLAV